jgi:hypothetical protein
MAPLCVAAMREHGVLDDASEVRQLGQTLRLVFGSDTGMK